MAKRMMSLTEFREEVTRVLNSLPEQFRSRLDNIAVDIFDEPSEEDLGIAEEQGEGDWEEDDLLFGLFLGVPLTEQEDGWNHPNQIKIFRMPHEEVSVTMEDLRQNIRDTLLHELAHHFGYSEEDLDEFEQSRSL